MLNNEELATARAVVKNKPPGLYTVKKLYGEGWEMEHRPRHIGKRFKASVIHDDLPGVRWVGQRSDRSQEYEVGAA